MFINLKIINDEFSKVARSNIKIQKSVSFLYTNIDISERESKKQYFLKSHQKIKYLGINLTKKLKDLHSENYKTLIKETIQTSGKIYCALRLEELILLICAYYPKQSANLL